MHPHSQHTGTANVVRQFSEVAPSIAFIGSMLLTFGLVTGFRHTLLKPLASNSNTGSMGQRDALTAVCFSLLAAVAYTAAYRGTHSTSSTPAIQQIDRRELRQRSLQNAGLGLIPGALTGVFAQLWLHPDQYDYLDAAAFCGVGAIALICFCACCLGNCLGDLPSEQAQTRTLAEPMLRSASDPTFEVRVV